MGRVTRRKRTRARRQWNRDRRASMHGGGWVRDWLRSADSERVDVFACYGRRGRPTGLWAWPADLLPAFPLLEVDGVGVFLVEVQWSPPLVGGWVGRYGEWESPQLDAPQ